jgi:hypothetical protein
MIRVIQAWLHTLCLGLFVASRFRFSLFHFLPAPFAAVRSLHDKLQSRRTYLPSGVCEQGGGQQRVSNTFWTVCRNPLPLTSVACSVDQIRALNSVTASFSACNITETGRNIRWFSLLDSRCVGAKVCDLRCKRADTKGKTEACGIPCSRRNA